MIKKILFLWFFMTIFDVVDAQQTLIGSLQFCGEGFGEIIMAPTNNPTMVTEYFLKGNSGKQPDRNSVIEVNGKFYGMTKQGGNLNKGVLFVYDTLTNSYINRIEFDNLNTGAYPSGSLIRANNGKLYGTCSAGGMSNLGTMFEYDIITNVLTKKIDFNGANGSSPRELVQASNNKIYGQTDGGGSQSLGVLFEYDISTSNLNIKVNYNNTNGSGGHGPMIEASNGKLYGMTGSGGLNNFGVIFEFDIVSGIYTKKFDFSGILSGRGPAGGLLQASNAKLYGMTQLGGINNSGVLFEYDLTSGVFTKKLDFNTGPNGFGPYGTSLIQTANGKLYGVTAFGGSANKGVLFEYDIVGNTYTKKLDFLISGMGNGPYGSMIESTNGKLYGLTSLGGLYNYNSGVLFEYKISTSSYSQKTELQRSEGALPYENLALAPNGKLYGTTNYGGLRNLGTIFEFDPFTKTYTKKFDFDTINGYFPLGGLLLASNGKLYGTASEGGSPSMGVLFEFDPITSIYTKKFNFLGTAGTARNPRGRLIQATNGKLYGTTYQGGLGSNGIIFEYDISTNTFTKKHDFSGINGANPYGQLMQATNGKLYGMTTVGGTGNFGTIYEYDLTSSAFMKLYDFNNTTTGRIPNGGLMQASNGKLYGMNVLGGLNGQGVLFEYNILTSTFTKQYDFPSSSFGGGGGTLMEASNGKLYGLGSGGTKSGGILFEYNYVSNSLLKLSDFFGWYSYENIGPLIEICMAPVMPININCLTNLCVGVSNSVTISINALTGATSYSWSLPAGSSILSGAGTNNITANLSTLTPGVYTISVAGVNVCGVGAAAIKTITIGSNASPTITATSTNSLMCSGQTATITSVGANTYTWSISATSNSIVVSPTITTNYTVSGTSINGCQNNAVFSQSVSLCTGIKESEAKTIKIYPNPVKDEVLIESAFVGKLQIYDVAGKIVYSQNMEANTSKINIKDLADGIYYLKVSNTNRSEIVKLVKH